MSYRNSFCSGSGTSINYDSQVPKSRANGGNGNGTKLTDIPSSEIVCHICHVMVALGDPDATIIRDDNGKPTRGWHNLCERELAVVQSKNTELCRTVNL